MYSSLITSVLEYSSFSSNIIAKSNIKKLIVIQNKAIKIINHQPFYASLSVIETSLVNLLDRFIQLNMKYITQALFNKNELVLDLWEDNISFHEGRNIMSHYSQLKNVKILLFIRLPPVFSDLDFSISILKRLLYILQPL